MTIAEFHKGCSLLKKPSSFRTLKTNSTYFLKMPSLHWLSLNIRSQHLLIFSSKTQPFFVLWANSISISFSRPLADFGSSFYWLGKPADVEFPLCYKTISLGVHISRCVCNPSRVVSQHILCNLVWQTAFLSVHSLPDSFILIFQETHIRQCSNLRRENIHSRWRTSANFQRKKYLFP